ncbi:MAG: hypothetical protein EOO38_21100, partial [Cytophagaceae bacterium]
MHLQAMLLDRGWCFFQGLFATTTAIEDQVIHLAKQLGTPRGTRISSTRQTDTLNVLTQKQAIRNSQSSRFGTGYFPYHTDAAHWASPGRYVIMACRNTTSTRATCLIPATPIISQIGSRNLQTSIFKTINGQRSFYASPLSSDSAIFRFDTACMKPLDEASHSVQNAIISYAQETTPVRIHWGTGDVLIFDNWRMMHAREQGLGIHEHREIIRTHITVENMGTVPNT